MINLEWVGPGGDRVKMSYDVHPASQDRPILIPAGAIAVRVWLGTTPAVTAPSPLPDGWTEVTPDD